MNMYVHIQCRKQVQLWSVQSFVLFDMFCVGWGSVDATTDRTHGSTLNEGSTETAGSSTLSLDATFKIEGKTKLFFFF